MNKRGQLSIETIVIIILALLVLVIVAASFSGGMKELWDRIRGITPSGEMTLSEATAKCSSICTDALKAGNVASTFCTTTVTIKDVGPRQCKDLTSACSC